MTDAQIGMGDSAEADEPRALRRLEQAGAATPRIAGDRFEQLWRQHEPRVLVAARRAVLRHQLTEEDLGDLVQETRIALYEAIPRLGLFNVRSFLRGSLTAYLRGIVTRRAADLVRSRARRPLLTLTELGADHTELEELLHADGGEDVAMAVLTQLHQVATNHQLGAAMGRLTAKQRDAVELIHLRDASYAEAAEVLGLPVGTVKSQVHEAIQRLRRCLVEEDMEL